MKRVPFLLLTLFTAMVAGCAQPAGPSDDELFWSATLLVKDQTDHQTLQTVPVQVSTSSRVGHGGDYIPALNLDMRFEEPIPWYADDFYAPSTMRADLALDRCHRPIYAVLDTAVIFGARHGLGVFPPTGFLEDPGSLPEAPYAKTITSGGEPVTVEVAPQGGRTVASIGAMTWSWTPYETTHPTIWYLEYGGTYLRFEWQGPLLPERRCDRPLREPGEVPVGPTGPETWPETRWSASEAYTAATLHPTTAAQLAAWGDPMLIAWHWIPVAEGQDQWAFTWGDPGSYFAFETICTQGIVATCEGGLTDAGGLVQDPHWQGRRMVEADRLDPYLEFFDVLLSECHMRWSLDFSAEPPAARLVFCAGDDGSHERMTWNERTHVWAPDHGQIVMMPRDKVVPHRG